MISCYRRIIWPLSGSCSHFDGFPSVIAFLLCDCVLALRCAFITAPRFVSPNIAMIASQRHHCAASCSAAARYVSLEDVVNLAACEVSGHDCVRPLHLSPTNRDITPLGFLCFKKLHLQERVGIVLHLLSASRPNVCKCTVGASLKSTWHSFVLSLPPAFPLFW